MQLTIKLLLITTVRIEYVIANAMTDDIVILAGKGHEEYEIDKNGKHPFSERNIAIAAAEKYYGGR